MRDGVLDRGRFGRCARGRRELLRAAPRVKRAPEPLRPRHERRARQHQRDAEQGALLEAEGFEVRDASDWMARYFFTGARRRSSSNQLVTVTITAPL